MGSGETRSLPEAVEILWCVLGTVATIYLARRIRIWARLAYAAPICIAIVSLVIQERRFPSLWKHSATKPARDWLGAGISIWWLWTMSAAVLLLLFARKRGHIDGDRRRFLRTSTAAVCAAVPAITLGVGVVNRKDFHINEVDISFPNLPSDLQGLRMLQISDIHLGRFYSPADLRRVVDASNTLRPDIAFITGDLITTQADPLDRCLRELQRLRATSGIWGCMGNHELYAKVEDYTEREARKLGIEFLRQQSRMLRFGTSKLNLVGVDFRPEDELSETDDLVSFDAFNLLLAHTPEHFETAAEKGFDLTLSGHTHGGQINLDVLGTNLNIVDLHTPYTKGLYQLPTSSIYVNSGLGTIGLPVRIGAPPEITLIRLCKS